MQLTCWPPGVDLISKHSGAAGKLWPKKKRNGQRPRKRGQLLRWTSSEIESVDSEKKGGMFRRGLSTTIWRTKKKSRSVKGSRKAFARTNCSSWMACRWVQCGAVMLFEQMGENRERRWLIELVNSTDSLGGGSPRRHHMAKFQLLGGGPLTEGGTGGTIGCWKERPGLASGACRFSTPYSEGDSTFLHLPCPWPGLSVLVASWQCNTLSKRPGRQDRGQILGRNSHGARPGLSGFSGPPPSRDRALCRQKRPVIKQRF